MFEFDAMAKKMKVPEYKKADAPAKETELESAEIDEEAETSQRLRTSEIIRRVVLAVSLIAIVVSSGMLLNEWRLSKQNDEIMGQFRESMEQAQAEARAAQERCDATLSMMREQYAGVRDDVQRLQRREGDLARMIMIGFGENEELVRRGSAAKIAEIGGAIENEQGERA
jgi:hypothetical protein